MKQTKSNDERSKSGHSVRVHINDDDDRVTSCVKMRIANNRKKKFKSVLPGKADPAEPSPMNRRERDRAREEASWPWNTISPEALLVSLVRSVSRGRGGRHNTVRSGSAAHKALHINEAVTFLHISPRQLSSFRFRFRRRRPLERALRHTTHRDLLPSHTPAPPTLKVRHKEKDLLLCVPGAACVCACVRA